MGKKLKILGVGVADGTGGGDKERNQRSTHQRRDRADE